MDCSDSEDDEIELHQVSKVYRCTKCKHCFLSRQLFFQHYPKFHPEDSVQQISGQKEAGEEPQEDKEGKDKAGEGITPDEEDERKDGAEKDVGLYERKGDAGTQQWPMLCSSAKQPILTSPLEKPIRSPVNKPKLCSPAKKFISLKQSDTDKGIEEEDPGEAPEKAEVNEILEQPMADKGNVEVITLSDSSEDEDEDYDGKVSEKRKDIVENMDLVVKIEPEDALPDAIDLKSGQQKQTSKVNGNEKGKSSKWVVKPSPAKPVETKSYLCDICYRLFTRRTALLSHVNMMHADEAKKNEQEADAKEEEKAAKSKTNTAKRTGGKTLERKKAKQSQTNGKSKTTPKQQSHAKVDNNKRKRKSTKKLCSPKTKEAKGGNPSPFVVRKFTNGSTYLCNFCDARLYSIEDLKKHVYNLHLKYKDLGEYFIQD